MNNPADAAWADALTALQLLARQPHRLGGVWLRAPHGPVREAWLQALAQLPLPLLRVPGSVDTARWLGGIDIAATLHSGRLREQPGLLRQAHGGLLCLPMAERLAPALTATLAQTLDRGGVDTGGTLHPSLFGVVALDESLDDEAPLAPGLQERLGLWIDLRGVSPAQAIAAARLSHAADPAAVVVGDSALQAICGTALALGIDSLRVPQLALEVASAHAAMHGRDHVADEDLGFACRTVLAPRARQWPGSESDPDTEAQSAQDTPPPQDDAPKPETTANPPDNPPGTPPDTPPENPESSPAQPDPESLQAMMVAAATSPSRLEVCGAPISSGSSHTQSSTSDPSTTEPTSSTTARAQGMTVSAIHAKKAAERITVIMRVATGIRPGRQGRGVPAGPDRRSRRCDHQHRRLFRRAAAPGRADPAAPRRRPWRSARPRAPRDRKSVV